MTQPIFTPSAAYLAQEEEARTALLTSGVTLGDPIALTNEQRRVGHTMCAFHIVETKTGYDIDGGSASTILSLLSDGTYGGKPADYTLIPCP